MGHESIRKMFDFTLVKGNSDELLDAGVNSTSPLTDRSSKNLHFLGLNRTSEYFI